ncbi:MAG TPA: class I SAM-dependent methyltransferase [Flavipsychrobacter sp.]|nr:class I SAM-dependent methyltransferase [Flavipsychrobacter sp.]
MDKYQRTLETWDKVAQHYQEKFMDLDLYDDTYDQFCQQVEKKNPHILEIGCGPGNITRQLLARRPDFKIQAVDVSPNMIQLASRNNPAASFRVMDCRHIDTLTTTFDAIVCGFCIPYLSGQDVSKLIKDSTMLLNDRGILYLSFIEGDYESSGYETASSGDKAYVYYYQADHFHSLLAAHFETIALYHKSYSGGPDKMASHLIFIARKK